MKNEVNKVVKGEVKKSVVNKDVKDVVDEVVNNVENKVKDNKLGKKVKEVKKVRESGMVKVDEKRVKEIVEESGGNKSFVIRELYKEYGLRNCEIKDVMNGLNDEKFRIVNVVMISNVKLKYLEGLKYEEEKGKGKE